IGQIALAEQDTELSKKALLAGLALLEKAHPSDVHNELAMRQELARLYSRQGNFVEAKPMAERGASLCEVTPDCKNSYMHATFLLFLARSYEHEQNPAKALSCYRQSRSIYASLANASAKSVQGQILIIDKELAGIAQASSKQ